MTFLTTILCFTTEGKQRFLYSFDKFVRCTPGRPIAKRNDRIINLSELAWSIGYPSVFRVVRSFLPVRTRSTIPPLVRSFGYPSAYPVVRSFVLAGAHSRSTVRSLVRSFGYPSAHLVFVCSFVRLCVCLRFWFVQFSLRFPRSPCDIL